MSLAPRTEFWTVHRASWAMGLFALLAVLLTIGDPGITMDEPLDVRPGRTYVETLMARGLGFFERDTVNRVFRDNAEHPPLGRWLLGIASKGCQPIELIVLGKDTTNPGLYLRSGRVAPAVCFAILVGLVTSTAGRRYGRAGGIAAGFALIIMPRVFAHAHFGALDTFVALFWTWALLRLVGAADAERPVRAMAWAGVFWGLALLTKIHGWLLPPVALAWTLSRLPIRKAVPALAAWTAVGLLVFVAGWPWLWYDSWDRLVGYFATTGAKRTTTFVQYFGRVYADRDVPWHYPWVYFAATVPLGLHALGAIGVYHGIRERAHDRFPFLLLGTIAGFLALFSTRVPVYDGERLFLVVFPLWAIVIGRGFGAIWDDLDGRRWLRRALIAATLAQAAGVVLIHPLGLSYYNALVGGLRGAERLGLELTYWGDAVNGDLLTTLADLAPDDAPAALAPTLVPQQGIVATTRRLARRGIVLRDEDAVGRSEWIVVSRREAYWKPEIRALVIQPPVRLIVRDGVWLSGLWRRGAGHH
ncbi:MAG: family glycosyltransferase, 4-amino-4-deoxy-L-arabinose transferase [Planctomycetota bacterium]|nr:family glycosyltransferase, 4-amino-4-deoxy-L-arabinose transferase [Planctomycetota bacterium]